MDKVKNFPLFVIIFFLTPSLVFAQGRLLEKLTLPVNQRLIKKEQITPGYRNLLPQIGLSLSGGGARGIAHIGVLKVFEDNNIPINFIIGTSMGNVIGGLLASGYTVDEIWQLIKSVDWSEIIQDKPPRASLFLSQKAVRDRQFLSFRIKDMKPYIPSAISPGQKLYTQLADFLLNAPYHVIQDYDDLKIPFRSIATDLITGKKIVFKHGDLAQVMLASSAIPLLFSPVIIDSLLLVDGGILENIPVEVLQQQNLDLIIAVDTTSPLRAKKDIALPWQLADQVTTIMQENQKNESLKIADILISPQLFNRTNTNFDSLETAYRSGRIAAQKMLPEIKSKILNFNKIPKKTYLFETISVTRSVSDLFSNIIPGLKLSWDRQELYRTLEKIYRSGIVDSLSALIKTSSDSSLVLEFNISVYPIIEDIKFNHNNLLSDSLILSVLKNRTGKRFNVYDWQNDREKILRLYRKHDFAKAYIKRESLDLQKGLLEISLDEGRIESIELIGEQKTKPIVILREYPLKSGDFFKNSLARQGINNIFSLGLFDRVQPEYLVKDGLLKIRISVLEKPPNILQFSYNFSRDDRLQTQFQWLDSNIFGLGNRLLLSNILAKRRYSSRISLQSDRLFNTYLSTSLDAFYFKRKHYTFQNGETEGEFLERRSGVYFSLGQQLRRIGLVSLQLRLEQISINSVYGSGYPIALTNQTSLRLQSIVDSLDKFPFPTNGRYHHFYYEISNEFLGNNIPFSKIYSSYQSYFTFYRRTTINPHLVWATADLTTPFQEMFILGGEKKFMGYRMDERRGRRLFQAGVEIRYFLPSKLPFDSYFSVLYNFGTIWKNSLQEIVMDDFIHGYGGKISFDSILGVFSFGYGKNSDSRTEYYFNLGFNL